MLVGRGLSVATMRAFLRFCIKYFRVFGAPRPEMLAETWAHRAMTTKVGSLLAIASALALSATTPTFAQEASRPDMQLETITVFGVRGFSSDVTQVGSFRGAKLVDTPMTVTVLPRDLLDAQQATNLNDTLRNVAGVTNSQTSTVVTSGQSVRGIPLDNRNAYRLNGTLPVINLMDMPMEDKERVELMKGASALYYGFASPAGVVNMTMKRPTATQLFDATLFGNMYDAAGGAVDIGNTLLGGRLGYRINAVYTGVDPGIENTKGARSLLAGTFDWRPTDDLTFQLDIEQVFKTMPEPGIFRFTSPPTPTPANPYPSFVLPDIHTYNPSANVAPFWAKYRAEETNVLSHTVWQIFPAWALTVDVGVSQFDRRRVFTTINPTNVTTGAAAEQFAFSVQQSENRNGRVQFDGKVPFWVLVNNLSVGWSDNIRDSFAVNAATTACAGGVYTGNCQTGIISVGGLTVNYLNPAFTANFGNRPSTPAFTGQTTRIEDAGIYIHDRIGATEYLEVLGGVRFGNYHENVVLPKTQTFHSTPTSKAVSMVIKPFGDDELSVYGSYIEALETTPAANNTAVNFPFQPPPSASVAREIGVKYQPWMGLLAQASFFNIGRGNAVIDGNGVYGLNGRSKFQGFDASVAGEITDDLSVSISGMLLQAKVVSGTPTLCPVITTACNTFTPTLIGRDVDNTAKVYGSVFAQYKLDRLWPELEGLAVNAGVYYVGARYVNPLNEARVGDYTLFDMGASYFTDIFVYPSTLRLSARNVGERNYWAATSANLLASGAPPEIVFSLTTHL
jgi:iron complex outermembrane receptor protein